MKLDKPRPIDNKMRVKTLIDELKKYPEDAIVELVISGFHWTSGDLIKIEQETLGYVTLIAEV